MPDLATWGMLAAFFGGLVSFFSPCTLPLVPGYLSVVTGGTVTDRSSRLQSLWLSICFVLGFSVVFIAFGASASLLGQWLMAYRQEANLVAGILIVLMFIMAMIGGGLWGSVPGFLKARFGVNEIITSLLLNYVAAAWIDHLLFGAWRDPGSNNFPITREFSEAAQLPTFGNTSIHAGLILAFIFVAIVAWILWKTQLGFKIRLTGDNPDAARYAGVNIRTLTILVFAASGAIAGLAGFSEVAGIHYRLQQNISIGYGYTGIIVAWLARNHPLGVVLSAFFMSIVFVSTEVLQIEYGLPISMVYLYQGIILFTVLGSDIFTEYRLRITRFLV